MCVNGRLLLFAEGAFCAGSLFRKTRLASLRKSLSHTDHSLKQWSAKLVKQRKAHLVSMSVIRRFWSCSLMLLKKTGWRPVEVSQVLSAVCSSRSLHSSKAVRSRQRLSRPHCPPENKSQMLLADGSVSVARSDCLIGHATCLCRASKQTVL